MGIPLDPRPNRGEPPVIQVIPSYSPRIIVRTLFIAVLFAISLYLIYLLRRPIGWVLSAAFLAVALSGPVNLLNDHMRRGFAISIVYLCLLLIPIGIGAVIVPPLVEQGNNLIQDLPSYAQDAQDFANKNSTLRGLEEDYNITEKLQSEAEKLPGRIGDAANVLGNIGLGVVNSLFALFTILVLAAFLLGSGRNWINRLLELRPAGQAARIRVALDHMGKAVGAYVGGVLAQATLAAVLAYILLDDPGRPVRRRARDRHLLRRPGAAGRCDHRRPDRRPRHAVHRLPDGDDHLGDLLDRLPATGEHADPAADPEARGQRASVHRARVGAVRRHPAWRDRRAGRDPGRSLRADRHPRVVGVPPRPDAAGHRRAGGPEGPAAADRAVPRRRYGRIDRGCLVLCCGRGPSGPGRSARRAASEGGAGESASRLSSASGAGL